jgi:hypothetical protein
MRAQQGLRTCARRTDDFAESAHVGMQDLTPVLRAIATAAMIAVDVAKSYGISCAINGGIAAAASGGTGFLIGCTEGIIVVGLSKHAPKPAAEVVEVVSVGIAGRRIFIESRFGKAYAKALMQALCAAFYPTCK